MSEKNVYVFTILKNGNIESVSSTTNKEILNEKIQDFLTQFDFSSHDDYLKKIETDLSIKYTIQQHGAGRTKKLDDTPSIFSTAIREMSSNSTFNIDALEKEASQQKNSLPKKQIQSTLF